MVMRPSASAVAKAPSGGWAGNIKVPSARRGKVSMVATIRATSCLDTSKSRTWPLPANATNAFATASSLPSNGGSGAVDAAAGTAACAIGCCGADGVDADGWTTAVAEGTAAAPRCRAFWLRYNANTATTSTTTRPCSQLPMDVFFFISAPLLAIAYGFDSVEHGSFTNARHRGSSTGRGFTLHARASRHHGSSVHRTSRMSDHSARFRRERLPLA